jgi:hypothetical protein
MSDTTIRNVVVRVSVEAGNSNLSALKSAVDNALSGTGSIGTGHPASTPSGGNWRQNSSVGGAYGSQRVTDTRPSASAMSDVNKLEIIYGKLNETQRATIEAMEKLGQKYEFTAAELKKLDSLTRGNSVNRDLVPQSAVKIATGSATGSARGIHEEKRRQKEAWSEAESGVAEWSRIKRKKAAEEKRRATELEQHRATAHAARVQTGKGVAQLAISTGGASHDMVQALAATEGIANIVRSATTAFGPYGVAVAAAATGVIAYAAAMREARDVAKQLAEVQYQIASIQSKHAYSQVNVQASMGMQHINNTPDRSQWHNLLPFIQQRTQMESDIAAQQSGLGDNWERRNAVRRRAEEQQQMKERKEQNYSKLHHLRTQLSQKYALRSTTQSNLDAAREKHTRRSKELLKKKILVGEQRYATQTDADQREAAGQGTFWATVGSVVGLGSTAAHIGDAVVEASGGTSDRSYKKQMAAITIQQNEANAEAANSETKAKESLNAINQEILRTNQQIAEVQADQVHVTQAQVDAARKLTEETRRTVTSQKQALGAMTPGGRAIANQIAAKHKRREQQKAAGLPVEEWDEWERENGRHLGGAVGRDIRAADEKIAESSPHADVLIDEHHLKEDEKDEQDKLQIRKTQGVKEEEALGATVKDQEAIADQIVTGMKESFDLQKLSDKLQEVFEVKKKEMDEILLRLSTWF